MYAIVIHGGAGTLRADLQDSCLHGVQQAADAGLKILQHGGPALEAVTAAVVSLEDDPAFNAGTGAVLNLEGEAEMDAGVMIGKDLYSGNVACVRRVKNPILLARKVMEETDHVLLAGSGAERFARAMGFADYDPVTARRRAEWQSKRAALLENKHTSLHDLLERYPGLSRGTVGAVALDVHGDLAAATSTGGVALKLPGRIGDSAVPGAGNYATPLAAASATGQGELMLRYLTTKAVCDEIAAGSSAQAAVDKVLARMVAELGANVGIIALDAHGNIGIGHATPAMTHAYATQTQPQVVAGLRVQT